jgi:type IV leader peptidase family protein
LSFRAVAMKYRVLRKRDGLGSGDAKLLSAAGAWVGWAALPDVVLLAAVCGLGLIAIKQVTGTADGRTAIIPFGPCLALALWTIYLFGSFIFDGLRRRITGVSSIVGPRIASTARKSGPPPIKWARGPWWGTPILMPDSRRSTQLGSDIATFPTGRFFSQRPLRRTRLLFTLCSNSE